MERTGAEGGTASRAAAAGREGPDVDLAAVFPGEGEMAARCRAFDWAATPLGAPGAWPATLRTAVRLMLAAPVATSLWIGAAYTLVYNDAYARILGAKHPRALGRSGAAVWDELWPALEPQFTTVRAGGPPVFADDALLRLERLDAGGAEDAWFTYALSALTDEDGRCLAVYNVAVEITERARAARAGDVERARLAAVFAQSPSFVAVLRGPENVFELVNDAYYAIVGHRTLLGRPLFDALPETRGQGFDDYLGRVRETGEPLVFRDLPVLLARTPGAALEERFIDITYLRLTEADGGGDAVIAHGTDVTDQVRARRDLDRVLAESEAARVSLSATNALLQEQAEALEMANEHLQNQAAELELQADELQATTEELAERTAAAEAAEGQLQTAFAQAPAAVALTVGPEHRFAIANARFAELVGRTVRPGQAFAEALPEIAAQGYTALLDRVYATGEPYAAHESHAWVDRGGPAPVEGWFSFVYQPLRDGTGRVTAVMQLGRDVTQEVQARRRVEALNAELQEANLALGASESRYRALFDSVEAGFGIVEVLFDEAGEAVDYRFVETNPAFVAQTGLVGAVGRTARELVPGLEAHWFEIYGRVALTGEPTRFENGSDEMGRWFDVFAFRVGRPDERRVALLFTDVTAARVAQRERESLVAELEVERARLAYAFQRAPAFLAILRGPTHVFELVNDAYYQLVGHREVVGKPVWEALPEVRGQGFEALLDGVLSTGAPFVGREVAMKVARTAGAPLEERFIDLTYLPLIEADATRSGIIAHGTDVTEQVRARREVERLLAESEEARGEAEAMRAEADAARREAEAANRAKAEFLATMSHELRTPLNAIGGYAELLEMGIRGPITEQQRTDLGRIQQSQRHLLGLVNEVLDLAKVDAGALRVERAAVRVGDTIDAALALVRPQAAAKALVLSETAGGAADRQYLGDEPRVRQVLVNLLANAVKFTAPGGRVSIECTITDAPPPGATLAPGVPYVALGVADTGRGVPAGQLERIFEPFTQAEEGANPYTRPAGGTGLGLAISRRLARLMGGDLTVASREGEGSTFTLWLPTPERRAARRPAPRTGEWPVGRGTPATGEPVVVTAVPALARVGAALSVEPGAVIHPWLARLRADSGIPDVRSDGAPLTDAELEDHAAPFVADVGLALRTLGEGGGDPATLLRDGTAILALLAERHGAQRARLGWSEAALAREFLLLSEVLEATVRQLAGPDDAAVGERACAIVQQLLAQAERLSRGGFRLASAPGRLGAGGG